MSLRIRRTHLFSFAAATFALTSVATAQNPVHWTAKATGKAAPGGETSVKLSATIDKGWHIYSVTQGPGGPIPTRITLPEGQPFALGGDIAGDKPEVKFDQNFGIDVETYENAAHFTVPVKVDKAAKAGTQKLQIAARYQVCNASLCLPPKTEKLSVALGVKGVKK